MLYACNMKSYRKLKKRVEGYILDIFDRDYQRSVVVLEYSRKTSI